MVIDLYGLTAEEVRRRFPEVYQRVYERVKPERDQNNRKSRRENWWLFGETNPKLRDQLSGLSRFIATVETSRHRFFVFLDASILPDNRLVNIALDDAYFLGVLSSRIHVTWALATGGTPRSRQRSGLRKDRLLREIPLPRRHRRAKSAYPRPGRGVGQPPQAPAGPPPTLALTDMYNVLAKLRGGEPLTAKKGSSTSKGWSRSWRSSTPIWTRPLPTRTAGRSTPARRGDPGAAGRAQRRAGPRKKRLVVIRGCGRNIRRPPNTEYAIRNTPSSKKTPPSMKSPSKQVPSFPGPTAWPSRPRRLRAALVALGGPASAAEIAAAFTAAPPERVAELLETLVTLGQGETAEGLFVG